MTTLLAQVDSTIGESASTTRSARTRSDLLPAPRRRRRPSVLGRWRRGSALVMRSDQVRDDLERGAVRTAGARPRRHLRRGRRCSPRSSANRAGSGGRRVGGRTRPGRAGFSTTATRRDTHRGGDGYRRFRHGRAIGYGCSRRGAGDRTRRSPMPTGNGGPHRRPRPLPRRRHLAGAAREAIGTTRFVAAASTVLPTAIEPPRSWARDDKARRSRVASVMAALVLRQAQDERRTFCARLASALTPSQSKGERRDAPTVLTPAGAGRGADVT